MIKLELNEILLMYDDVGFDVGEHQAFSFMHLNKYLSRSGNIIDFSCNISLISLIY